MITKEIASKIWHCYSEIENANKMLEEMKNSIGPDGELELKDGWNERRDSLQLHIPRGHGGFKIERVSGEVALIVIQEHIKKQYAELERLKVTCKIQLA